MVFEWRGIDDNKRGVWIDEEGVKNAHRTTVWKEMPLLASLFLLISKYFYEVKKYQKQSRFQLDHKVKIAENFCKQPSSSYLY